MREPPVKRNPSREELIGRLMLAIRASQNISEAFDDKVAEFLGINRTDLRCLDILEQRGALTAGQLAEAMHLTSGAITTLVDRLEAAGYARRVRDTEDRRRVVVDVTDLAKKRVFPLYEPLAAGSIAILGGRTTSELQAMVDFLEQGHAMVEGELETLERRVARKK